MVDDLAIRSSTEAESSDKPEPASGTDVTRHRNQVRERPWRLYSLLAVVAGCSLVIVGRLVLIQVVQHDHYAELAKAEHWQKATVEAQRGEIVDASGVTLAVSVPYEDVYASTKLIGDDLAGYTAKLAPILETDATALRTKLGTKQDAPLLIKAELPADRAAAVRKLGLDGIDLKPGQQRVHPQGNLAAQLLGIVGADEGGLSGIEAALDEALGGQPGWVYAERDTVGDEIALGTREAEPPIDGARVRLTIDRYVQQIAERELAAGVEKEHAKSGSVVVLDPKTGAILALAGYPSIRYDDPGLFDSSPDLFRVAAAGMYEPGSVFKIFTMGAALDSGTVRPETTIVDSGVFRYAGGTIRNARIFPPHPASMTLVLQRSSNVGAAYAATQVGAQRFYEYLAAFGFGQSTGSSVPGEAAGLLNRPGDAGWDDFELATNAFGQGIAVTPLQLAAGAAAIANGGTLLQPYLISDVDGPTAKRAYHPTIVRQVISPQTARDLTEMMVATVDYVESGQHRLSYVPQYRLAGKTGTAEIPTPQGYDTLHTIASFVGFGPADAPRFVVVVRIDRPTDNVWAESVAAPVFRKIAEQLLAYYRVAPDQARLALTQKSR